MSVKNEAKSLVKVVGKEFGFEAHGKGSGGVRDLMKVKDEDKKDLERGRESKGKNLVVKNAFVKTEVKQPSSASTRIISSSTNVSLNSFLECPSLLENMARIISSESIKHAPINRNMLMRALFSTSAFSFCNHIALLLMFS